MRNFIFYIMVAVLMVTAPIATAADSKIGVVSMQTVINDSQAGKDAIIKLKKKAESEKVKLDGMGKEYKSLQDNYDQKKLFSRPEVLEQMEEDLLTKKREIELYRDDTRNRLQRSQARITGEVIKQGKKTISEYAQKNNFTLVVEKSEGMSAMAGLVLYADESIDLTKTVIKLFDEQYKAGIAGKQ